MSKHWWPKVRCPKEIQTFPLVFCRSPRTTTSDLLSLHEQGQDISSASHHVLPWQNVNNITAVLIQRTTADNLQEVLFCCQCSRWKRACTLLDAGAFHRSLWVYFSSALAGIHTSYSFKWEGKTDAAKPVKSHDLEHESYQREYSRISSFAHVTGLWVWVCTEGNFVDEFFEWILIHNILNGNLLCYHFFFLKNIENFTTQLKK